MSVEPTDVVKGLAAAFRKPADVDGIAKWFAEDGVYHNMPDDPLVGRAAIREWLVEMVQPLRDVEFVFVNMTADGDRVYAERLDWVEMVDGTRVSLPCNGVFEIRDGEIVSWRDYYDAASFQKNLAAVKAAPQMGSSTE